MTPEPDDLRSRLVERILRMPESRLAEADSVLDALARIDQVPAPPSSGSDWPHAPLHRISDQGTYIVTAGTYGKEHHFAASERRDALEAALLNLAAEAGWQLEAWAVFSNHYHFVGQAEDGCDSLADWIARLHRRTATTVNEFDRCPGRRVWFNYWDTQLTFEKSYLARLNYVHQNPVRHGLVRVANQYRWSSAAWFERTATRAQVATIYGFKIDKVNVQDDFQPILGDRV